MNYPFVVLGMPRSRTFWISRFLSQPDRPCEHDPSVNFRSVQDVRDYFSNPNAAASDTALCRIWARMDLPRVTVVVVHRALPEIVASLRRCGIVPTGLEEPWWALRSLGGLHINAEDWEDQQIAEDIYRYCTGNRPPPNRWDNLIGQNLQCDPVTVMRAAAANVAGIRAVFGEREVA